MSNSKISKITISDVVYDLRDRATEENLGRLENSVETLGEDLSKLKTTVDNLRPTVLELNDEAVRKKDVDEVLNSDDNATNPIQNNTVSRAIDSLNDRISNLDIGGLEITVDSELNLESTNPVQNKVITNALNELEIVVDSELDEDSINPVQNKVITEALKELEPDRDLDTSSTRPIQNGTVSYYIESINSNIDSINSTIEDDVVKNSQIDSSLSTGSTNPVQNKVITSKINELSDKIDGLSDVGSITSDTVEGWGFTKNEGTITGITVNGDNQGTSGVVFLNFKTINSQSIIGEGDIYIPSGSESSDVASIVYDGDSTDEIRKPIITTNTIIGGGCYTVDVRTVFGYQVLNIPIGDLGYGEEVEIVVSTAMDGPGNSDGYLFNIYHSGVLSIPWSGGVEPGEFSTITAKGYREAPGAPLIEDTVLSGYNISKGSLYRLRIKAYPGKLLGTCESFNY